MNSRKNHFLKIWNISFLHVFSNRNTRLNIKKKIISLSFIRKSLCQKFHEFFHSRKFLLAKISTPKVTSYTCVSKFLIFGSQMGQKVITVCIAALIIFKIHKIAGYGHINSCTGCSPKMDNI